jgi:hypothetical protein
MQSFLTIASALIFFHSYSFIDAKPTGTLLPGSPSKTGPSKIFPYRKYEDFQVGTKRISTTAFNVDVA